MYIKYKNIFIAFFTYYNQKIRLFVVVLFMDSTSTKTNNRRQHKNETYDNRREKERIKKRKKETKVLQKKHSSKIQNIK